MDTADEGRWSDWEAGYLRRVGRMEA